MYIQLVLYEYVNYMGNLCMGQATTATTSSAASTTTVVATGNEATSVTNGTLTPTVEKLPSITNALVDATNDIPFWSLKGKTLLCKVVSVYDGDTCNVVFMLNNEPVKMRMRMSGYDSPEMRNTSVPNYKNTNEYSKACNAKQALIDMVMNRMVLVECSGWDKYGRLLGNMYTTGVQSIHVNQWMIGHGHGYVYNGGKKREELDLGEN